MKLYTFKDMHDKEVRIQLSGSGDYRIYYENGAEDTPCLLLSEPQALILINALKDLIRINSDE